MKMAACWARRSRRWTARASMCQAARRPTPSSVLMNAIPANVAGVGEIIMVVPTPARGSVASGGKIGAGGAQPERNPLVLAAAAIAGVDRAFTIGGAQAVAALAYGTATIPPVDKITGPGNAYVAEPPSGVCSAPWAST